jgi:hypothetical protein
VVLGRRLDRDRALDGAPFGSFHEATDSGTAHRAAEPIAVDLVDATMIALGREIAMFPAADRAGRQR